MKQLITRLHLWLGLLIGVQVLLWMASGVVMSWIHLDTVRGEDRLAAVPTQAIAAEGILPVEEILARYSGAEITGLDLRMLLDRPVWALHGRDDRVTLIEAVTGETLSPISESQAREIARRDYGGKAGIARMVWVSETTPGGEYRGALPAWRADFDDWRNTRLYIPADRGQVASRRNRWWRLFDFFWMLHIMDYSERTNFNSLLLRALAGFGLLFASTGLGLVVLRLTGGRYSMEVKRLTGRRKD